MDKNFVHIDDLFKKGLSGVEEPERAGAWLRMQDLLDKEMPADTVIAGGKRPYGRYLTALLILLCVGGSAYFINNQIQNTTTVAATGQPAEAPSGIIQPASPTASLPATAAQDLSAEVRQTLTASSGNKQPLREHSTSGANHAQTKSYTDQSAVASVNAPITTLSSGIPSGISTKNTASAAISAVSSSNRELRVSPPSPATAAIPVYGSLKTATQSVAATPFTSRELQAAEDGLLQASSEEKIYQTGQGDLLKASTDTINQIVLRETTVMHTTTNPEGQRVTKPTWNIDTIQQQRVAVTTLVALSPLERTAVAHLKIEPAPANAAPLNPSVLYASGERSVKLVTLSKYAVASRKSTPEKINQMISNTQSGVSNMFDGTKKYYAGIVAGGNMALGDPAAYGLQLGLAGFYALSERLTAGMEIRYINRYYSNYKFLDNYTQYNVLSSNASGGGNWIFNYEENVQSSSYRIQNIASVELPVYLNYSFGRLSVFGGANFAYAFTTHPIVSNEEFTSQKTITTPTQNFPIQSATSRVTPEDWKQRFGIGYVAGMAYDFNRRFSLDLRVSQNLWDNAASDVSKEVSKRTFKVPSLQLGVTINFGRRDKIIYILDNR